MSLKRADPSPRAVLPIMRLSHGIITSATHTMSGLKKVKFKKERKKKKVSKKERKKERSRFNGKPF